MKKFKIFSYICLAIIIAAGIATVVFAILNLAGVDSVPALTALRFVIGSTALLFGTLKLISAYFNKENEENLANIVTSAMLIGLGVFLYLGESELVLSIIVGKALPIIIACCGYAILIKGIVYLVRGGEKMMSFAMICIGLVFGVIGTLFAAIIDTVYITWIILGIIISLFGTYKIIKVKRIEE